MIRRGIRLGSTPGEVMYRVYSEIPPLPLPHYPCTIRCDNEFPELSDPLLTDPRRKYI
jgi:hypothetical protein